jgi:PIN domain nuclease of toxin-antitoxin system
VKVLLDSCSFLWLTQDSSELSSKAKQVFLDANNDVFLSSVSVWEILIKNRLGKLPLPGDAHKFIEHQCKSHLIEYLPLMETAVFQLAHLPNHHRDPFDRMLVCQAIADDLTILTPDKMIALYPAATLW